MAEATFTVALEPRQVQALLAGSSGAIMADLLRRGRNVVNRARVLCPVDEGTLRASIEAVPMRGPDGLPMVQVGSRLKYAIYVHEGTGIYGPRGTPIRPVRASILRWPAKNNSGSGRRRYRGGQTETWVYARQSSGSPARPFLRDALPEAQR